MMGVEITTYAKDDHEAFQSYIDQAFHEKYILKDPRYIDWQFTNVVIAKAEDRIIGHFGYRDVDYKIHDRVQPVRVLMNLFVLEAYRIAGIGALLTKAVFDTPHPVLVAGYKAATGHLGSRMRKNWHDCGYLNRFFAVLNREAKLFENFELPSVQSAVETEHVDGFETISQLPEHYDAFWQKVRNRFPVTAERTHDYLNWRFLSHPFLDYSMSVINVEDELNGYVMWRIEEAEGFRIMRIVDMIAHEAHEQALIQGLVAEAKKQRADAIDFLFSGTTYHERLRAEGFVNVADTGLVNFPTLFSPLSFKKTYINIGFDIETPFEDCFFTKAEGDQDRPNPH